MASNSNRGGSNRGRNNNPSGRNQYSGWMNNVTDRPLATAAAVGGAVAAGVFLWSRRNQISDQLSNLSEQISDWREGMGSDSDPVAEGEGFIARRPSRGSSKNQSDIAEEALTLKSTGKKSKRPADPTVDEQTKAGAIAY